MSEIVAAHTAAALLARLRASGAPFERLVFTDNRRVMVSVGDRGRTLRLNESFRDAPDEVLRAVAALYARKGGTEAARRVLRDFFAARPAPAAAPRPRTRRNPAADRPYLTRLAAEFERVNRDFFGGALPTVPLYLSGRMQRRNGHFSPRPLEIVISRRLCAEAHPGEAEETLRHEMIHLWQHHTGLPLGHGLDFRRMARRLGVHPRAARVVRWRGEGVKG
jgi:predicted SprT family Zn-dependent metalloprotease